MKVKSATRRIEEYIKQQYTLQARSEAGEKQEKQGESDLGTHTEGKESGYRTREKDSFLHTLESGVSSKDFIMLFRSCCSFDYLNYNSIFVFSSCGTIKRFI